jgi:hypothetical protein
VTWHRNVLPRAFRVFAHLPRRAELWAGAGIPQAGSSLGLSFPSCNSDKNPASFCSLTQC